MSAEARDAEVALSLRRRERLSGWGMVAHGYSHVCYPESPAEIGEVFELARRTGRSVGMRGGGLSYGDAALNSDGLVLNLTRMNRALGWDPASGVIEVEAGYTIEQLWRGCLPDGWWPPVVPGTMQPTLGGVASANIHGKNNFAVGPLGEHILSFELVTPTGETLQCSRASNPDLFHAAIGGFGLFGVTTRLKLQMKKVHSGQLMVDASPAKSLPELLERFESLIPDSDYLVGWVDCTVGGTGLGRGLIHRANYLPDGADPEPVETLRVRAQDLPGRIAGVIPKSLAYLLGRPLTNNPGIRLINAGKYHSSRWALRGHRYPESHAGFAFLLDYVPNWKWVYLPGGLTQYQVFVPAPRARQVFETILRQCLVAGLPSYLGVVKRHRPDAFLLSHGVDGYSLALDFPVTRANRDRLWALLHRLDDAVLDSGGRFYFAKDLTLTADRIARIWPSATLAEVRRLKERTDPEGLLQTDLSRRLELGRS